MKRRHPSGAVATMWVGFFLLAAVVWAQEPSKRPHIGIPQDWSQRQIVFSRAGLLQHPELLDQEPRVRHQVMQRWQAPKSKVFQGVDTALSSPVGANQRDWSVPINGHVAANMFPAKFGFDPAAKPDCYNDYVVFGTSAAGKFPFAANSPANLVAYYNLYSGPGGLCGAVQTVLFAYDITTATGGHVVTSPVMSLDGTKIAFVESVPANAGLGTTASSIFHVLTWTRGQGTIGHAAAPTAMTSVTISGTNNCTFASPWVDYKDDVAYVATDDSTVYKIAPVFGGTPTLVNDGTWPIVNVSGNSSHLTAPVLDRSRGVLIVGGANGNLYQINTATGAKKSLQVGKTAPNHGILGAPIVDVTNGTTFVVSSNDGSSGVLVEADTTLLTELARGRIGEASHSGTGVDIYQPAFSDSYYNDPSTGVVRLCGTGPADITPWQYAFGFAGRTMQTPASFSQQLVNSTAARCTGWTEFFNPNINGGTDFFFFGLTQDCTVVGGGTADGCVVEFVNDVVVNTATINGGPSGIVIDNYADPTVYGQASSIYFTAIGSNIAYKYTQNGLN